jgi:hypothetical protein
MNSRSSVKRVKTMNLDAVEAEIEIPAIATGTKQRDNHHLALGLTKVSLPTTEEYKIVVIDVTNLEALGQEIASSVDMEEEEVIKIARGAAVEEVETVKIAPGVAVEEEVTEVAQEAAPMKEDETAQDRGDINR